jgi:hypothetical protein
MPFLRRLIAIFWGGTYKDLAPTEHFLSQPQFKLSRTPKGCGRDEALSLVGFSPYRHFTIRINLPQWRELSFDQDLGSFTVMIGFIKPRY